MDGSARTEPQRRIWIECTRTWFRGGNTGIQRVVRNVVREAPEAGLRRGVVCEPLVWAGFGPVRPRRAPGPRGHWLAELGEYLGRVGAVGGKLLVALVPERLRRRLPRGARRLARLRAWLAPRAARALAVGAGIVAFPGYFLSGRRAEIAPGDVLLLADAGWGVPGLDALVEHAHARGAQVGVVVHDLIPLEHPAACPQGSRIFGPYAERVVSRADFAVANSDVTRQALLRLAASRRPPATRLRVGVFRLGAELDLAHPLGEVRDELGRVFEAGGPVYLTVGTLEPRKNHGLLLDALEELWERGGDATLVVAGRQGFRSEYLVARIRLHPEHGRRLFLFTDLSDTELAALYDRAAAVLCASFAEGFGLPIVEALVRRVPVFASDIPAHREVGDKHCVYFDRRSPQALREALEAFARTGGPPAEVAPPGIFRWPDWWESTVELIDEVLRLAGAASPARSAREGGGPRA